jgi:hypothetical protein
LRLSAKRGNADAYAILAEAIYQKEQAMSEDKPFEIPPMPGFPNPMRIPGQRKPDAQLMAELEGWVEQIIAHDEQGWQAAQAGVAKLADAEARIAELEAIIKRDMGEDYLSLQALYIRQLAEVRDRDRTVLALREAIERAALCSFRGDRLATLSDALASTILASTAHAAQDAERRILEAAWERVVFHARDTGEATGLEFHGYKGAILNTQPGGEG